MSVTANSSRLRTRLRGLVSELPRASSFALATAATETKEVMQEAARADWSSPSSPQVGFDVEAFNQTIDQVEVLANGGFGILNVDRMGTEEDFEDIAGVPGAWHMGRRAARAFGNFVVGRSFAAQDVAATRQAVWGQRQPQWWLLNYGNTFPGAYAPAAGTHTIENVAFDMVPRVRQIVSESVTRRLRSAGVLI